MLEKYSKLSAQSWNVEVCLALEKDAKQDIEPGTNLECSTTG